MCDLPSLSNNPLEKKFSNLKTKIFLHFLKERDIKWKYEFVRPDQICYHVAQAEFLRSSQAADCA